MEHKWYALSVHSGKEDFVSEKIHQMIAAFKEQKVHALFSDVLIPKQSKIEIKDGKKVVKKKRMLPGYIFVKMHYDEQTAPMLTNIEEVRGFVRVGTEVYPLTDEEVARMMQPATETGKKGKTYTLNIHINDAVKICEGVFKDFIGKVSEVDETKGRLKVLITIFGRETPVDLDVTQVQKL